MPKKQYYFPNSDKVTCPLCGRTTNIVFRFVNYDVYLHVTYTDKGYVSEETICKVPMLPGPATEVHDEE